MFVSRDEQEKVNPILYYSRVVNYVIAAAAVTTIINLPFGGVALALAGTLLSVLCSDPVRESISQYQHKFDIQGYICGGKTP